MRSRWSLHSRLIALAGFASAFACHFDVGDQVCTTDADPYDYSDQCPYGPPDGLKKTSTGAGMSTCTVDTTMCVMPAPAWSDVYTVLTSYNTMGGCAASKCHDSTSQMGGFMLPVGDADAGYQAMKSFKLTGVVGPYIDPDNVATSWFVCSLGLPPSPISPMPSDNISSDDLATLINWAECGEKEDGGGGAGGAGGAGTGGGGGTGGV